MASQALTQPPQSYVGYSPYGMQVSGAAQGPGRAGAGRGRPGALTAPLLSPQNVMTALPGQDATLPPPQQPYMSGQQPMYQQVDGPARSGSGAGTGTGGLGQTGT